MTMMTTITTTRRGKFSTASSVLLLCAALLITKSCGIFALSGDGNLELLSQANAWNQVDEGSGWEELLVSSAKPDETTGEWQELTTTATEEVDQTTSYAEVSTEADVETTAEPEAATTAHPDEPQQDTTVEPEEEKPTSSSTSPDQPTTTPNDVQPTTTEAVPVVTTIAPTPAPVFECPSAGLFPHISGDCALFYNCRPDTFSGELVAYELVCPPLTAFSPSHKRCMRDLSECPSDEFVCLAPGRFAASSDTVYYTCVANTNGGYYKYLVRCSPGTRFEPLLGRCWRYDWTQFYPGQSLESIDLSAIKLEQKQIKTQEKLLQKAEKQKEKEARKQQELEEKLAKKQAKKEAKQQAKANKPISFESVESLEYLGTY